MLDSSLSGPNTLVDNPLSPTWLIESDASHHMTGKLNLFPHTEDITPLLVGLPDGL